MLATRDDSLSEMANSPRHLRQTLQLLCAGALTLGAWGLAGTLAVGFAVNPSALTRSLANGSPTAPWQVGALLLLLVLGAGGVLLARQAVRRQHSPRPAHPAHEVSPGRPRPSTRRRSTRNPISLRTRLFFVAALLLAGTALLASMITEWVGPEASGFGGPGTLLSLVAFAGSLALGVTFAQRLTRWRVDRADAPISLAGDGRPVLALIWWPLTAVSTAVPLLMIAVNALHGATSGSGLPMGIVAIVGVFGFISLPARRPNHLALSPFEC